MRSHVALVWGCLCAGALSCGGDPPAAQDDSAQRAGDATSGGEGAAGAPADLDAHSRSVSDRLAAITRVDLPGWEGEVKAVLLESYDTDRSGSLETQAEVDAILCEVWRNLNTGYGERTQSGESVRDAYGFAPETFWLGFLGVQRSQREHLRQRLLDCGVR